MTTRPFDSVAASAPASSSSSAESENGTAITLPVSDHDPTSARPTPGMEDSHVPAEDDEALMPSTTPNEPLPDHSASGNHDECARRVCLERDYLFSVWECLL